MLYVVIANLDSLRYLSSCPACTTQTATFLAPPFRLPPTCRGGRPGKTRPWWVTRVGAARLRDTCPRRSRGGCTTSSRQTRESAGTIQARSTYLFSIRFSDPAGLVRDARGVFQDGERSEGHEAGRRCEQCECLDGWVSMQRAPRGRRKHASGRCSSTGSFMRSRAWSTSRMGNGRSCCFIRARASSNHARMSVRRASSPVPNSVVTAASVSGCGCGRGRSRTVRASAVRVNP